MQASHTSWLAACRRSRLLIALVSRPRSAGAVKNQKIYKVANAKSLIDALRAAGAEVATSSLDGVSELPEEHRRWVEDALAGRDQSGRTPPVVEDAKAGGKAKAKSPAKPAAKQPVKKAADEAGGKAKAKSPAKPADKQPVKKAAAEAAEAGGKAKAKSRAKPATKQVEKAAVAAEKKRPASKRERREEEEQEEEAFEVVD